MLLIYIMFWIYHRMPRGEQKNRGTCQYKAIILLKCTP